MSGIQSLLLCAMAAVILAACSSEYGSSDDTPTDVAVIPLNFSVQGMDCQGCVETVKGTLMGIDGVQDCTVSLEENSAVVKVDSTRVADAIVKAFADDPQFTVTPGRAGG